MLLPPYPSSNESATRRVFDELGKLLLTRHINVVLADAATQGLFAYAGGQHLAVRRALDTSLVVHSVGSLRSLLKVNSEGLNLEQLPPSVGVEMARNALDLSDAKLAIALTLCPNKHLNLPQCTVLGMHWWYLDKEDGQSSWMLSQQFVVTSSQEDLPAKLVTLAARETIKVLRLQDTPAKA